MKSLIHNHFLRCNFILLMLFVGSSIHANDQQPLFKVDAAAINPEQLVVMIESVSEEASPRYGAGFIIGKTENDNLLIATARHNVYDDTDQTRVYNLAVRFHHDPGQLQDARLLKYDFGKDIDLALLEAKPRGVSGIPLAKPLPLARLEGEVQKGEHCSFVGYSEGQRWSQTSSQPQIVDEEGEIILIKSREDGPGISGGVAIDTSNRILGLVLKQSYTHTTVLKLSAIKKYVETSGLVFSLSHGKQRQNVDANFEQRLRTAFSTADWDLLKTFEPAAELVPTVNHILNEPATVGPFVSKVRSPLALEWLSKLCRNGLDPNRLIQLPHGKSETLLHGALDSGNYAMARILLKAGASPYAFEELWQDHSIYPKFLFPVQWLRQGPESEEEQKELLNLMIKTGLADTSRVARPAGCSECLDYPSGCSPVNEEDVHLCDLQARYKQLIKRFGNIIPQQIKIGGSPDQLVCQAVMRYSRHDWCRQLEALPYSIDFDSDRRSLLREEFLSTSLVKLMTIIEDNMYVLTYSGWSGSARGGFGFMKISRNAERIEWYRLMNTHSKVKESWERFDLVRDYGKKYFYARGFRTVKYKAEWPENAPLDN